MLRKAAAWVLIAAMMLASVLVLGSCESEQWGLDEGGGTETGEENGSGSGESGSGSGESGSESAGEQDAGTIDEDGTYDQKEDVAEYLSIYKKLPKNYIKKKEAKKLGWQGGSVEKVAPGKAIGGDHFGNYEKKLPNKKGRTYYECDIDTLGRSKRGPKRMIYSDDGLIYYTGDHYNTFQKMPQSA